MQLTSHSNRYIAFAKSKWFTRGWTLQELLAPAMLSFFDSEWIEFGTKSDFKTQINEKTGIPVEILDGSTKLQQCSIACRMSLAADRQTTRAEDMAYCLLGIFDIHMPLLYGEGDAAFTRLQEEILRNTTDMSLFAWKTLQPDRYNSSLLARSPENFRDSSQITLRAAYQYDFKDEIAITNRGLRFDNGPFFVSNIHGVILLLHCWEIKERIARQFFVCLTRTTESWVRSRAFEIASLEKRELDRLKPLKLPRIFISRIMNPGSLWSSNIFSRTLLFDFLPGITMISAEPSHCWDVSMQLFKPDFLFHGAVHISVTLEGREPEEFIILCRIMTREGAHWKSGCLFIVLSHRHAEFETARNLLPKMQLSTKEGFDEICKCLGRCLRKYSQSNWDAESSSYHEHMTIGVQYKILLHPHDVSVIGEDGDLWEAIELRVACKGV